MLTFLLVPLLAAHSSAQYAGCPETYGVQVYPHEQYCDKFYKCVNGKNFISFVIFVRKSFGRLTLRVLLRERIYDI